METFRRFTCLSIYDEVKFNTFLEMEKLSVRKTKWQDGGQENS